MIGPSRLGKFTATIPSTTDSQEKARWSFWPRRQIQAGRCSTEGERKLLERRAGSEHAVAVAVILHLHA